MGKFAKAFLLEYTKAGAKFANGPLSEACLYGNRAAPSGKRHYSGRYGSIEEGNFWKVERNCALLQETFGGGEFPVIEQDDMGFNSVIRP